MYFRVLVGVECADSYAGLQHLNGVSAWPEVDVYCNSAPHVEGYLTLLRGARLSLMCPSM